MRASGWIAALLLGACGGSTPPSPARPTTAAPPATPRAPFAAFAVYSGQDTVLIPVDPARPIVTGAGTWIADPARPERIVQVVEPDRAEAVGLPECACSDVEHACIGGVVTRELDASEGWRATFPEGCVCWGPADTPRPAVLDIASPDDEMATCDPPPPAPEPVTAFVGGVVYREGMSNSLEDECGNVTGFNVYDAYVLEQELIAGARVAMPSGWQHCQDGRVDPTRLFGPDGVLARAECPAERPAPPPDEDDEGWDDGNERCRECDEGTADGDYLVLGSGQLCDVGVSTGVAGDELTWVTCAPLGPDRCPSALDPCGDAAPFGARLDPAVGYWVSTDGRWALTGAGEILEPTTEAPVRSDAPEGPHVGVLFFGDASVLAEALARDAEEAPASADEEEPVYCDEALTCRGGLRCDPQTVTCVPPCASDSDCATRGLCGATCTDGLCGPAPDGSCDEDERCPQGYECADGRCVQCQHDGDCTDGRVCERGACDPPECAADDDCDAGERCAAGRCAPACDASRSASDLGNDCALRMREGAWAEARQLCECALASSPSPRTEGALRYNLGRIAEEQGDRAEAIRQYRRSLEVRPGNAAVRSRLDALAP